MMDIHANQVLSVGSDNTGNDDVVGARKELGKKMAAPASYKGDN